MDNFVEITTFEGMDVSQHPAKIDTNCMAKMVNCILDEGTTPDKRPGTKKVIPTSLGPGKILHIATYTKDDGSIEQIFFHGTKMYKWVDGNAPVLIFDGLSGNTANAFQMDKRMFVQDGSLYRVYDGTNVATVTAKIPTVMKGSPPAGGGSVFEAVNMLTPYAIQSFSSDGTSTTYNLVYKSIDNQQVSYSIDGGKTWTPSYRGVMPRARSLPSVACTASSVGSWNARW
jgi:hypothetical protein